MITEDFCSYEIAKLLEEKGLEDYGYSCIIHKDGTKSFTHQMALKWLREVHKVHISIYPFNRELPVTDEFCYTCDIATNKLSSKEGHLRGVWKTYEGATEAAIKHTLENLV